MPVHTQLRSHLRSIDRSRRSLTRPDRPEVFRLDGREWDLLDGVFAPPFSPSTGVALELLHEVLGARDDTGRRPRSLLEIGSGTGVVAVTAALAGCDRVVATDINPRAVLNTRQNAARHGVTGRLRALAGDLFTPLARDERFDIVYWHSNFVRAPEDYTYRSDHERAYVDAGYAAHRRYLAESARHVTAGGSVLLHFSDRGDVAGLRRLAREHGRGLRVLARRRVPEGLETVEHMLIEVTDRTTDFAPPGRTPALAPPPDRRKYRAHSAR
ncbi:50S ribosomal protein L11 methyltransferase [Streptomyces gamaensis]|uniref:50S ribosomal protein L11 methyltransferase n=1 Tax=Streptomyces gamaensis TaxID=1763542 RepID=A0ABW0YWF7_9ACTN